MENIFVEFLPPWIETGLQPAFYDKESGTVLQQTARMYARVNMLIRMFNKLSKNTKEEVERFEKSVNETVADYINRFNELYTYVHDYFDNLDVQEEINNKLDAMLEDGTLQSIISAFLQSSAIWGFDTVADMKVATNLIDGSYTETYGFHSVGDEGGANYKIRTAEVSDVIDESTLIAITGTNLVAELIIGDEMNIAQYGLTGDGETDESDLLNIALKSKGNDYLKLDFNSSKTYLAQQEILIYSNTVIDLQGSTLKSCYNGNAHTDYVVYGNGLRLMSNYEAMTTAGYGAIKNVTICNGTIDGDTSGASIFMIHGLNIHINNIEFKDCCVGTHIIDFGGCKDVFIENCYFNGYLIDVDENYYREMVQFDYAGSGNVPYWGSDPSYQYDNLPCVNFNVNNCEFSKGDGRLYPTSIGGHNNHNLPFEDIKITNCTFDDTDFTCIRLPKVKNVIIKDNIFNCNKLTKNRNCIYNRQTQALTSFDIVPTENVTIEGNVFNIHRCTAILSQGFTYTDAYDVTQTVNYKNINIVGNTCTGRYDSENTQDVTFVACAYTDLSIRDNYVNKCKYVVLKVSGSTLATVELVNNRMYDCYDFLHSVAADTHPEVVTYQSNNIWTDSRGTININNFKIKVSLAEIVTSAELDYTKVPLSVTDNPFVDILSEATYSVKLPIFLKRFKVSGKVYYMSHDSTTPNKLARIYLGGASGGMISDLSYGYVPSGATQSIPIGPTVFNQNTFAYNTPKIGVECYMPATDQIGYRFGAYEEMTYIEIEGF